MAQWSDSNDRSTDAQTLCFDSMWNTKEKATHSLVTWNLGSHQSKALLVEDSRNNYRALFLKTAKRFGLKGIATHVNGTPGFGMRKNKDLPPMFPSRNKKHDSLLTSTNTPDGLPMNNKSDNSGENTAVPDVSSESSGSSVASRSLPAIPTPGVTSPTSFPPAPLAKTPELGNANMLL
ncbi:hypothetical protein BD410DRAFT_841678 [Rickenella mellea]|uniref:Uncharacterized protein n=1 Tax=Rickenella mellea TaxID=50990 RepID=A0A4Y7PZ54_9AGAM|nr:hypothetical protein BD410DRAFT_841678 [Rickenella mellea]